MKSFSLSVLVILMGSSVAYAESGNCEGKTEQGKKIQIEYFTNGYSDDGIDYYAHLTLGSEKATYALFKDTKRVTGHATRKSQNAGHDFGEIEIHFSSNHLSALGELGGEKFKDLTCSYNNE